MWNQVIENEDGTHGYDVGPTIRSFVNEFVKTTLDNYLHMNKEIIPALQAKIVSSEKERQEISSIQKKTKERNKRTQVYNKKLRDCKYHLKDKLPAAKEDLREETSIFITEGDSASGTITKARNAETQAVFSLRGKPINSYKESRKKIAENEELNLLINALGLEEDIEDLRYNKIIVATDADDDGMHIRMLVLTYFMKYYPDLIRRGHLYILQTPLFRVRNKKKTIYCYSDEERIDAIKSLGANPEITRFKGLGEISPDEFSHFIGPGIRLEPIILRHDSSIMELLKFYMGGKNPPERQKYIIDNLRMEDDTNIDKLELIG
jgi:topoisomerase-4 subunit B